jgi:DegV family protein with EDD domain
MKKFQVFTDSTADVVKANRDKFELDYLKMVFTIEDKEYDADLDWQGISAEEYYNKMRQHNRSITGLVKTTEFEEKFTKALEAGLDILYVSCSSRLSGSCNNGNLIAKELLEKYPDRKIVCLDSLRSCYSEGMIALDGAKMALEGKSLEETVAYLEENKLKYQTYVTVDSLNWLKQAGRVKASTAFFGNLFGVKPVILSDAAGNNYAYKKMKGRKSSLDELVATVAARIENPAQATVYVEHSDCLNDAEYVANSIKEKVAPKSVEISYVGPIIGASIGPGSIGVSFYGEKVTVVSGD